MERRRVECLGGVGYCLFWGFVNVYVCLFFMERGSQVYYHYGRAFCSLVRLSLKLSVKCYRCLPNIGTCDVPS
jgi:hypothetical protein